MRLLIVDDHPGVRAMIREIVDMDDLDVRESASGEAAVQVSREFSPDVVTMDARMPGIGGIEAARQIHQLCPTSRIVVVSAYDVPAMRAAALQAGAVDFVAKDDLNLLRPMLTRFSAREAGQESEAVQSESQAKEI